MGVHMSDRRRCNKVPLVLTSDQRKAIGAEIERLIAVLDIADGDPDLEETGDREPSLGSYYGAEPDLELDPSDDEPSLGSFDRMLDQTKWCSSAFVNGVDLEVDRSDDEPSLGAPIGGGDQRHWAQGDRQDREEQHDHESEGAR